LASRSGIGFTAFTLKGVVMSRPSIKPLIDYTQALERFPALYDDEVKRAVSSVEPEMLYLHVWMKQQDGSDDYLNFHGVLDSREIDIDSYLKKVGAVDVEQLVRCLIITIVQCHRDGHKDGMLRVINDFVPVYMHISSATRVIAIKAEVTADDKIDIVAVMGIHTSPTRC
jgi:hypothetical protein